MNNEIDATPNAGVEVSTSKAAEFIAWLIGLATIFFVACAAGGCLLLASLAMGLPNFVTALCFIFGAWGGGDYISDRIRDGKKF